MKELTDQRKKKLTLNEQAFIQLYTDPDSPTFGNGTQSYLTAYPHTSKSSVAGTCASVLLKKEHIRSVVNQITSEKGYGQKARTKRLEEIQNGTYTSVTTDKLVRYKDIKQEDGSLKRVPVVMYRERTSTPKAAEIVSAANVLNKMDGTYNEARAMGNLLNAELSAIFKAAHKASKGRNNVQSTKESRENTLLVAKNKGKLPESDRISRDNTILCGNNAAELPLSGNPASIDDMMEQARHNVLSILDRAMQEGGDITPAEDQEILHPDRQANTQDSKQEAGKKEPDSTQAQDSQAGRDRDTGEGGHGASPSLKVPPLPPPSNSQKNPPWHSASGMILEGLDDSDGGDTGDGQPEILGVDESGDDEEVSEEEAEIEKIGVEAYGLDEEGLWEELKGEYGL